MNKEIKIMDFLHANVFDPTMNSKTTTSETLKKVGRYTIMRMDKLDADGVVKFSWSAIVDTERRTNFANRMRQGGFIRFEEVIDDF